MSVKFEKTVALTEEIVDLSELSLGSTMRTKFPQPDDILNFTLTIEPDEGMYKGGSFHFSFTINQNFPHDPPKVKCTQKIYHPNIDLEGNVCLNILREDWKPVLNLNAVIVGLQVCGRTWSFWEDNPVAKENQEPLRTQEKNMPTNPGWCPTVSVPRAQRIRSPQQGSRRRPAAEPRRLQAQRAHLDERRLRERRVIRATHEVSGPPRRGEIISSVRKTRILHPRNGMENYVSGRNGF